MSKSVDQHQIVQNPLHDDINLSEVGNVTDNTIRNAVEISDAMQFSSKNAANAFTAISVILQGAGTNEEKRKLIAVEQSKVENDTTLQVFANMAIGMLGSSKEGVVDEKEAPGIEKLSKAFAFLGHQINDEDNLEKDKRITDMAGAYASLMSDKEIDEDTKKSIETAFKQTPDIAKIAQIQEGVENKDQQELEEVKKTIPAEDLKDSSTYDDKNWEDFKSKAIYGAKGAIAIGLLFAPGGIFLAPLFLYATKDFGRNPDDIEKEQKDAEAAELESGKALEFLNAFKKYLPDPKEVKPNEVDEQEVDLEVDYNLNQPQPIQRKPGDNKITTIGEKAEEFVKKEKDSLTRTQETLKANEEGLKRVEEVEVQNTVRVDETTKAALASIIVDLGGTKMEDNHKGETTSHGVTAPQVGGGAARNA
jgi:hypothetical protein